jgi:hypothetical protein
MNTAHDEYEYIDPEELLKRQEEERRAKLAAFANKLTIKRREAVDGRKRTGIEEIWQEDEEYYDGIDDANRESVTMIKPATLDGRPIVRGVNADTGRSNVFVNITQPYVDMAVARASEMALPTDDRPFKAGTTPIPEVADSLKSKEPMPDGQVSVGEAAKLFIDEMTEKAEKAETQIWDWLVESRWHSEMRQVIEQAGKIGAGCLKGPFPIKRKQRAVKQAEDGTLSLEIYEETKPASKQVDVWNLFPYPADVRDIRDAAGVFERDYIGAKQLRDLKGTGYLDDEIEAVLDEGPNKCYQEDRGRDRAQEAENYEIWYYHGTAEQKDLEAAGCPCEPGKAMNVVIVMVNDRVIKASMSVLESGEHPYDVMTWRRRSNHWAGVGIARQVRTAQRMVNAASRNLMDNAGVSAGPQIIINKGVLTPADGEWTITPLKMWMVDEDADIQDVKSAFTAVEIPTLQAELTNIITMALEFAERSTSMPLLLQGQQGASTHTVGGMQILQGNASAVLRNIARIFDDDVVEPHIARYYEWLLIYGKDDSIKGDFSIVPQGSTAFFERDAQNQMIMQLLPMANDPEFELDKSKLMTEVLKMQKITPDRVRMTDEAIEARKKQMAENPPQDPALAVAQLKAQSDMEREKLKQESDMSELNFKAELSRNEFALKIQMQESEQEHQERMKRMELEIKMIELSQAQQISLDSIKASLASDTLKLQTQKELSMMRDGARQVATPPTEPAGRAENGRAYEQ